MKRHIGFTHVGKVCQAFTLIEVLVSLTVVGLLFGFGFVNFRDFSRRQQMIDIVRSIAGEIRLVQSKASAGEKPDDAKCRNTNTLSSYSFQILDATSYQIVANCLGGNVIIKPGSLPDGITMSPTSGTLSFKVLGQGTNIVSGGSFVITFSQTATNNTSSVTVSAAGEIK